MCTIATNTLYSQIDILNKKRGRASDLLTVRHPADTNSMPTRSAMLAIKAPSASSMPNPKVAPAVTGMRSSRSTKMRGKVMMVSGPYSSVSSLLRLSMCACAVRGPIPDVSLRCLFLRLSVLDISHPFCSVDTCDYFFIAIIYYNSQEHSSLKNKKHSKSASCYFVSQNESRSTVPTSYINIQCKQSILYKKIDTALLPSITEYKIL